MNLKNYRELIKNQLLKNLKEEVKFNHELAQGRKPRPKPKEHKYKIMDHEFEPVDDPHENFILDHHYKINKLYGKPKPKHTVHRFEIEDHEFMPIDDEHAHFIEGHHYKVNKNRVKGGKLNLKKEFNKGLHSVEHGLMQGISEGVKKGTSELTHEGISQLKKYLSPSDLEEEAPEMAEVAAGIRRRKRTVSAKEKKRHELIRNLMRQKGMTLADASHYIKQHDLI